MIGREDLTDDPAFATSPQRNRNRKELIPLIAEAMLAQTMDEWIALLEAKNVPCGPINNMKQVFEDPQVRHREMRCRCPTAPACKRRAWPTRSACPHADPLRDVSPLLGEHNNAVLQERLGLSAERIAELQAKGVV